MESNNSSNTSNKVLIILIVSIIISSIALIFLLFNQSDENIENNDMNNVVVESTTDIVPNNPEEFNFSDIPVPDVIITQEQLSQNNTIESCWTIINGVVYEVSELLLLENEILEENVEKICGKDSTNLSAFENGDAPPLETLRDQSDLDYIPMGRISP